MHSPANWLLALRAMQWVVPTCLVFCLRRRLASERARVLGAGVKHDLLKQSNANPFASPFAHAAWLYVIIACALVSTVIITISHFK